MEEFEAEFAASGNCAMVTVRGELDIATAPQLVSALEQAEGADCERIVVDLLATTFIDSTGLTTLLRAHKRVEANGSGDFAIVCGPHNIEIRRVIDLMGFNEVFTIHETLAAAGCGQHVS